MQIWIYYVGELSTKETQGIKDCKKKVEHITECPVFFAWFRLRLRNLRNFKWFFVFLLYNGALELLFLFD